MSELRELYQEMILDHNKSPRNRGKIEDTDHHAEGHNPLCGDQVEIYVKLNGDLIEDISFEGQGCAISTASASLMTEALKGKTLEEAKRLFEAFHRMVTESGDEPESIEDLEKLEVFSGVRDFPSRVKCATLAWHTFQSAVQGEKVASTE